MDEKFTMNASLRKSAQALAVLSFGAFVCLPAVSLAQSSMNQGVSHDSMHQDSDMKHVAMSMSHDKSVKRDAMGLDHKKDMKHDKMKSMKHDSMGMAHDSMSGGGQH